MLLGLAPDAAPTPTPAPAITLTVDELQRYTGAYSQTTDPAVTVAMRGQQLVLREGQDEWPLVAVGPDRFEARPNAGPARLLVFVRGASGPCEFVYTGSRAHRRLAAGTAP
jgi:hypothetical protein